MRTYNAFLMLKDDDGSSLWKNTDFPAEDDVAAKKKAIDWVKENTPVHYESDELIVSRDGVELWRCPVRNLAFSSPKAVGPSSK